MSRTMPLSIVSVLISAGLVWGAIHQHNSLAELRQEQETRLAQISRAPTATAAAVVSAPAAQSLNPPSDLIQLRAEFARLSQRQRELEPVKAENESLKAKLAQAASAAAAAGAGANDAGYIRKSQARMAGYGTPEDTVQTMLWAINNRDTNAVLEAFDPQMAAQMAKEFERNGFDGAEAMVRLKIMDRQTLPDGRIVLNVLSDADPNPEPITFSLIGGKWRIQDKH